MEWTCPNDGDYFVVVKGYGDSVGSFDVTVTGSGAGSAVSDPCTPGGATLTAPRESITFQPQGDYTTNLECTWMIQCPTGNPSLTVTAFESEADYDFLTIYNGPTAGAGQVEQYSGSLLAGEVSASTTTATSSALTIQFTSDESISAGGFIVNYQCAGLAPPSPPPPYVPAPPPSGVATSNEHIVSTDGTPEDGTVTADSHEWYAFTGLAGSTYQIEVLLNQGAAGLDDSVLDLVGTDRATVIVENDDDDRAGAASLSSYIEWTCPTDGTYYVMIKGYDSYSTGTFQVSVNLAGDGIDGGATGAGGGASGEPCDPGGSTMSMASSTIVFQPNGNYQDNSNCDWKIVCPRGTVHLDFTQFDTESDWDFVRVYDGTTASSQMVGELTGALVDIPDTHFDATSSNMLIEFTSDESIAAGGFQARFTCA